VGHILAATQKAQRNLQQQLRRESEEDQTSLVFIAKGEM
jgi:hypothetical protein